jgi:hypothetical protein
MQLLKLFLMGVLGEIFRQLNGEDWYSTREVCFVIEVERVYDWG